MNYLIAEYLKSKGWDAWIDLGQLIITVDGMDIQVSNMQLSWWARNPEKIKPRKNSEA